MACCQPSCYDSGSDLSPLFSCGDHINSNPDSSKTPKKKDTEVLQAASLSMKMFPQLNNCDDSVSTDHQASPRGVMAHDLNYHHHFGISLNGSVEVEMSPEMVIKTDESTSVHEGEGSVAIPINSLAGVASIPSLSPPRHRKSQSLTSFPSHIPFPLLGEEENAEEKKQKASIKEDNGPARRAHRVLQELETMHADDTDEHNYLAEAASVAIGSILASMRLHTANVRVQRYGCGALQQLAYQSDTNKALILEADATVDIISAMRLHHASASIQESGCLVLASLVARGSALIAEQDGIQAILEGMRLHGEHGVVQRHGCHALLCLACSNADLNSQIADLGAIETIMFAVSNHPEDCQVRAHGSAALWSLAYMNTKNTNAIEKAGGMAALSEILSFCDSEPLCKSNEDRCMQLVTNQEANGNFIVKDRSLTKRFVVDDIMSVFVRPIR